MSPKTDGAKLVRMTGDGNKLLVGTFDVGAVH